MNVMDRHPFAPSRPGGTVCIAERMPAGDGWPMEPCGYPAGHPIHEFAPTANTPAEARTGVSDRAAAALTDLATLRELATYPDLPVPSAWLLAKLDRIEQALRGAR